MVKRLLKKGIAVMTAAVLTVGLLPAVSVPEKVEAATGKRTVNLGTSVLTSVEKVQYQVNSSLFKEIGGEGWTAETGQRVYFGHYDGTDTAYRVLMNDGQKVLLDSDSVLYKTAFDSIRYDSDGNRFCNWADSLLRADLLAKYQNNTLFSAGESSAILLTALPTEHTSLNYAVGFTYMDDATKDYIFALSAQEVLDYYTRVSQLKNVDDSWWTRTTFALGSDTGYGVLASSSNKLYAKITESAPSNQRYVCPAVYLDSSKVLFTTATGQPANAAFGAVSATTARDWRLTLKDGSKQLTLGAVSKSGNHITVPYTYSGTSANRITAMITDREYTDSNAQILFYGRVSGAEGVASSGSVTFDLPAGLSGTYHLYLMAEQANGNTQTSFSSIPAEIPVIHTIDLTELDVPQPGAALDKTAKCLTAGVNGQSLKVTWTPADTKAQYGIAYQASVTLYPTTGYFGENVTATLYGAATAPNGTAIKAIVNSDGSVTVTVPYPKVTKLVKGCEYTDTKTKGVYTVTKLGKSGTVQFTRLASAVSGTVTIPKTVKIGGVSYKVTSIAKNAFKNNKKITKVVIGANITTIGTNAFYGCTKLKTVTMGSNVTTINQKAFYKCTALTKITLPSKVKKIGKQAFYGCKKLKTITVKTTKLTSKKIGSKAFKGIYAKATVKVPKKKLTAYKKLFKNKGVGSKATFKKS